MNRMPLETSERAQEAASGRSAIPRVMRAAALGGPGEIRLTTKPVPSVGEEEVLVRVLRATLCGTDLKILSHAFFGDAGPPSDDFTPGHEYAGVVAAVGNSVTEVSVGDHVVTEAHRGCMRCRNCLSGSYTECLNYGIRSMGHRVQGMTVDGGLAEYVVNHVSTLHKMPDRLDFDDATILTTVGTVLHAVDALQEPVLGARVAIIGPGPIGLAAVQVLRELGADHIVLVGTREERLSIGRELGADVVVHADKSDAVRMVRDSTPEGGVDIVFECSGAPTAVDSALQVTRRGGSIVLIGFFDRPVTADLNEAVMKGITVSAVRGEGPGALPRAITLLDRGKLHLERLVSHHFALRDVPAAYATYAAKNPGTIKVMIDVSEG